MNGVDIKSITKMNIEIRHCRSDDFVEIIPLLRQLWEDKPINPEALRPIFERALHSSSKVYLCCVLGNQIIGFGSLTIKENLWPKGHVGYIDELVVKDSHRGTAVGTAILDRLVTAAQELNCCKVELDCAFFRERAHEFYEKNGFYKRCYVFCKDF
jgi:glucosamine-phosphate N-acetyltransferase